MVAWIEGIQGITVGEIYHFHPEDSFLSVKDDVGDMFVSNIAKEDPKAIGWVWS